MRASADANGRWVDSTVVLRSGASVVADADWHTDCLVGRRRSCHARPSQYSATNSQKPAIPNQGSNATGAPRTGGEGSQGAVKRQPNDHPNQLDKGAGVKEAFENEGEGSRSAARNYDKANEEYVKSGRVDAAAQAAEKAIEGPEGNELRAAEEKARATSPAKAAGERGGGPARAGGQGGAETKRKDDGGK